MCVNFVFLLKSCKKSLCFYWQNLHSWLRFSRAPVATVVTNLISVVEKLVWNKSQRAAKFPPFPMRSLHTKWRNSYTHTCKQTHLKTDARVYKMIIVQKMVAFRTFFDRNKSVLTYSLPRLFSSHFCKFRLILRRHIQPVFFDPMVMSAKWFLFY